MGIQLKDAYEADIWGRAYAAGVIRAFGQDMADIEAKASTIADNAVVAYRERRPPQPAQPPPQPAETKGKADK